MQKRASLKQVFDRLYSYYGPQDWWPARSRLEVIVGAILTQNTSWANVEKAILNLRKSGALSSTRALRDIKPGELAALIRPAGYYNLKSKRLKNFIAFLYERYGGSLKKMSLRDSVSLREELLTVNGIGAETCDSILLYAFNRPVFVVDTYTKRIFSRHGFFKEKSGYGEVQGFFIENLPGDTGVFNEFHALIVKLAKEHCRKRPDCAVCPIRGF